MITIQHKWNGVTVAVQLNNKYRMFYKKYTKQQVASDRRVAVMLGITALTTFTL